MGVLPSVWKEVVVALVTRRKMCARCGKSFAYQRSHAKFCSDSCRVAETYARHPRERRACCPHQPWKFCPACGKPLNAIETRTDARLRLQQKVEEELEKM